MHFFFDFQLLNLLKLFIRPLREIHWAFLLREREGKGGEEEREGEGREGKNVFMFHETVTFSPLLRNLSPQVCCILQVQ